LLISADVRGCSVKTTLPSPKEIVVEVKTERLAYAMIDEVPEAVAVIEHQGVCWPVRDSLTKARWLARKVGAPGIWKFKPRGGL
jgi:hypothetical protein